VFAAVENRARWKAGVELELHMFQTFRVREGMIASAAGFLHRRQALGVAGLAH
jgi:hypothetical protein